jgi:hypothetical protein
MVHKLDPCIGDVWEYCEGGRYTVVGFVREFGGERDYVLCEGAGGQRIWPRDRWLHLVPYRGADAPSGAMVRPFTLVRRALAQPVQPAETVDVGASADPVSQRRIAGLSHP